MSTIAWIILIGGFLALHFFLHRGSGSGSHGGSHGGGCCGHDHGARDRTAAGSHRLGEH